MKKRVLSKIGLLWSVVAALTSFLVVYLAAHNAVVSFICGGISFFLFAFLLTKTEDVNKPLASDPMLAQRMEEAAAFNRVKVANGKVAEMAGFSKRIKDPQIRASAGKVYESAKKVVDSLFQSPEDMLTARNFLDYYLPVTCSILSKYVRAEEKGVVEDDSKFREKVQVFMGEMETAMKKQLRAIFEDDLTDAGLDIDVMTTTLKNEGLLDNNDFSIKRSLDA